MCTDPILSAFDHRLRRGADQPIVVSTRHQATVGDVDRMARMIRSQLAEHGIKAGAIIALSAANGPGFLAGLLAIRRANAVALLFDARTPSAEEQRTAAALGAGAMLDSRQSWPRKLGDFALTPLASEPSGAIERSEICDRDVAVIKLTSGSTGQPRGIVTPSTALVADDAGLAKTMGLTDNERILAAIPMSHSYGLSSVVMPALMRRSILVLPDESNPLDPMIVARERGVTFLPTVPAFLQALVSRSTPPALPRTLRLVTSAGAPLKPATAVSFRQAYGHPIQVFYGASESGGITFDRVGTAGERGSLGTPIEGVDITLESSDRSKPAAEQTGRRGTVTVRSAAVARSYLPADPSLTDGCFRTRDLAVLRGGELFLQGRLDDLINVRGKKVNPREVEAVLSRLEGVDDVVTLGVLRPGQDEGIVRSFVACRQGSLSYEAVQAWCRQHLADYKVPRSIVLLKEIPRTARGKLDRTALLELQT